MRFSADFLDEIRARVPISTVVGSRVTFDHKKSNVSRGDFWACCPFHGEKTPSFHCDDRRGRYHCFGCGESGDHFRFLTEIDGLSFPEAVERIADMAGIALPKPDPEAEKRAAVKATLYDVMELASAFFEQELHEQAGADARNYLRARALPGALQQRFRLGYADNSRNRLKEYLASKGVGKAQMEAVGLIVTGDDIAVPFDRFRDRIMFPITDLRGRIVGFGGRALSADVRAKYLNSPETELFHKGSMLYNAATARSAVQARGGEEAKSVIVVEGYMDVIALAKAGIDEAVAPLGTALTEEQLQLLWRISPEPILCFDGDDAGLNAAWRAVDRALPLLKAGISLRFAMLPEGKDPDDIVREEGAAAFRAVMQDAKPLAEMLWFRETSGQVFDTPEKRAALEKNLSNAAFTIKDESLRHYYLQDVRERVRGLFRPAFKPFQRGQSKGGGRFDQQGGGGRGFTVSSSLANSELVKGRGDIIPLREAAILATLANHPLLWNEDFERLAGLEFANRDLWSLHQAMLDVLAEWQPDDGAAMHQLLGQRDQTGILQRIEQLVRNAGLRSAFVEAPVEDAREALKQAIYLHLRAHNLHKRLREIEAELMENPDTNIFVMLNDVRAELARANATEALIEGFGAWETDTKRK